MLVRARYENDKFITTHLGRVDELHAYNKELRKDELNGWSKGKNFRRVGNVHPFNWAKYADLHPGWEQRMYDASNYADQKRAWLEFCNDPLGQDGLTVEKMLH